MDKFISFLIGCALIMFIFIMDGAFAKKDLWDRTTLLINQCEQPLPRNESCKLIAVKNDG